MQAEQIAQHFHNLQSEMCALLDAADGQGHFESNLWQKSIGEGDTRVLQNGAIIEKAGLNFSFVQGEFTPRMEQILGEKGERYAATGISSILHASNPWVPTIHMNVRYFELNTGKAWFGGGIDLTPMYVSEEDAKEFHLALKRICDAYHPRFYTDFKAWADEYFFIPHRNETRGIGGIFYDRIEPKQEGLAMEDLINFSTDLARFYPVFYSGLMKKYGTKQYTEQQLDWQRHRRGRYVEFNLIYDRGTRFGLESDGNIESILVSLPPDVKWTYNHTPKAGSIEEKTIHYLTKGIDWISR